MGVANRLLRGEADTELEPGKGMSVYYDSGVGYDSGARARLVLRIPSLNLADWGRSLNPWRGGWGGAAYTLPVVTRAAKRSKLRS